MSGHGAVYPGRLALAVYGVRYAPWVVERPYGKGFHPPREGFHHPREGINPSLRRGLPYYWGKCP